MNNNQRHSDPTGVNRPHLGCAVLMLLVGFVLLTILLRLLVVRVQGATPLSAVEAQIVSADHEITVVFDARGREIGRFQGTTTATTVYPDSRWWGGVLTHNHLYPNLRDLSISDLQVAERTGLREIRAVSSNPLTVCYATRRGRAWPHFAFAALTAQLRAVIVDEDYDAMHNRASAWYAQLAASLGFTYGCDANG